MSGFIVVGAQGQGFVESGTEKRFVPFGANYFDPKSGWAPKIWSLYDHDLVARQLGQMAEAGLNCIRVFLDFKTLAPAERQYSEEGFRKVDDMVATAGRLGIRIIFSGPNTWEGRADYRAGDDYTEPHQMELLCDLWRQLGKRYGQNPTVMTWDLRNEPMVGFFSKESTSQPYAPRLAAWQKYAKDRLHHEVADLVPIDGAGVDRELYREYVNFLEGLADKWVMHQTQALRESGARQMISVGLIQWAVPIFLAPKLGYACFNPRRVEKYLDYMSIHFYPMLLKPKEGIEQELALQKAYLEIVCRGAYIPGKPLMMEEFGWKGGKAVPRDDRAWPQEHQSLWGDVLMDVTSRCCSGWLNWGYADAADPNADISAASGLWTEDEQIKHWGKRFAEYARKFTANPPKYQPAGKRWHLDRVDFLYDNHGAPKLQWLAERLVNDPAGSVEVVFSE